MRGLPFVCSFVIGSLRPVVVLEGCWWRSPLSWPSSQLWVLLPSWISALGLYGLGNCTECPCIHSILAVWLGQRYFLNLMWELPRPAFIVLRLSAHHEYSGGGRWWQWAPQPLSHLSCALPTFILHTSGPQLILNKGILVQISFLCTLGN